MNEAPLRPWLNRLLASIFRLRYTHRLRNFERSLENPQVTQADALKKIICKARLTEYGQAAGVTADLSVAEFRKRVPLVTYDDIQPWVERQCGEWPSILTPGTIVIFEKTSGSRGPAKYIPYNQVHLKTFENMFVLWALDLFRNGLKFESGRVFFLVSPKLVSGERTANGIPVGFKDDSDYLGGWMKSISNRIFVSTPELHQSKNYLRDLAHCLLKQRHLEVISVWSPSLLLMMFDLIQKESWGETTLKANWPNLKLISCWDSAMSKADAERVRYLFPHVWVQGKGLLATEAAMTIPWGRSSSSLPLIEDIYFEFIDQRTSEVLEIHELREQATYEIVVTAPNGFLRYKMGDLVRARGRTGKTPMLDFIGRKDVISDLTGEKLSTDFVATIFSELAIDDFAVLLPRSFHLDKGYIFATSGSIPDDLVENMEARLRDQHHYHLARELGQLKALQAIEAPALRNIYYRVNSEKGIPVGQVKSAQLVTDHDLAEKILKALAF